MTDDDDMTALAEVIHRAEFSHLRRCDLTDAALVEQEAIADAILTSDWLAQRDAGVRAEALREARAVVERPYEEMKALLVEHRIVSYGVTAYAPDRCACGVGTFPARGDDDVNIRRARAFAVHLADVLIGGRRG